MKASEKLRNPRMKFVTKLIRAAIEIVSCDDGSAAGAPSYNSEECSRWMEKIAVLAELWNIDSDFLTRQQVSKVIATGNHNHHRL